MTPGGAGPAGFRALLGGTKRGGSGLSVLE